MKVGTAKAISKSWDGARSLLSVFARKKYYFRFAREVVKYTPLKYVHWISISTTQAEDQRSEG